MAFEEVMRQLVEIGLLNVLLPFILIFIIIYSTLQYTRVLGVDDKKKPKNNINAMVAFVLSFLAVIAARVLELVTAITQNFAIALIAGLAFFIITGFAGGTGGRLVGATMTAIFVGLTIASFSEAGVLPFWALPAATIAGAAGVAHYL